MLIYKLLQKLPIEIVYYIQKYSYNIQSEHLLNDLLQYLTTKELLNTYYFNKWLHYDDASEYTDWLLHDLLSYANNDQSMILGLTNKFYNIFYKHIILNKREDVNNYLKYFNNKPVNSQINILWGLFSYSQRNEFIRYKNIF